MAQAPIEMPESRLEKIVDLLGGMDVFHRPISTMLDAHEIIQSGLPSSALTSFARRVPGIGRGDILDKAIGISLRAARRKKGGCLSREQSGRLYKAAEIVAIAVDVFGSITGAERFLCEPAMALNRMRPVDLLTTPAGAGLVQHHLVRLDFGVYT